MNIIFILCHSLDNIKILKKSFKCITLLGYFSLCLVYMGQIRSLCRKSKVISSIFSIEDNMLSVSSFSGRVNHCDYLGNPPPTNRNCFLKIQIIPKSLIAPSKASIGGSIKDILKIDTVASLQCCQFLLKK